jgi:hypothetical protein
MEWSKYANFWSMPELGRNRNKSKQTKKERNPTPQNSYFRKTAAFVNISFHDTVAQELDIFPSGLFFKRSASFFDASKRVSGVFRLILNSNITSHRHTANMPLSVPFSIGRADAGLKLIELPNELLELLESSTPPMYDPLYVS